MLNKNPFPSQKSWDDTKPACPDGEAGTRLQKAVQLLGARPASSALSKENKGHPQTKHKIVRLGKAEGEGGGYQSQSQRSIWKIKDWSEKEQRSKQKEQGERSNCLQPG